MGVSGGVTVMPGGKLKKREMAVVSKIASSSSRQRRTFAYGNQKRKIIIIIMTIRRETSPKGKERPMLTQGDEAESVILRRVEGVSFSFSFNNLHWVRGKQPREFSGNNFSFKILFSSISKSNKHAV